MTVRNRSSRWRDVLLAIVCVGFFLGPLIVVYLLHRVNNADSHAALADRDAAAASSAAAANQAALHSANVCIRNGCGTPVPTPAPVPIVRGERGPGPTDAQIASAVNTYCGQHDNCTGTPSKAQVTAAVHAFCSAGVCRGTSGTSGQPGQPGAAGASGAVGQSGAQGTGPTDDQIATAVAAYCTAHGNCTGPAGPTGSTGPTGPAGRGITSIDCQGLGIDQLVIHYTDGPDQTVPCSPQVNTSADRRSGGH